jgi:hypothetical protein
MLKWVSTKFVQIKAPRLKLARLGAYIQVSVFLCFFLLLIFYVLFEKLLISYLEYLLIKRRNPKTVLEKRRFLLSCVQVDEIDIPLVSKLLLITLEVMLVT